MSRLDWCFAQNEMSQQASHVVDDAGIGLSADGSDLVPVRAIVVDNKGVPKGLAGKPTFESELLKRKFF